MISLRSCSGLSFVHCHGERAAIKANCKVWRYGDDPAKATRFLTTLGAVFPAQSWYVKVNRYSDPSCMSAAGPPFEVTETTLEVGSEPTRLLRADISTKECLSGSPIPLT